MRYLVVLFSLFLLSCNKTLYTSPIGVNIQNIHQFVADTTKIKAEWNKMLADRNIKGEVSHFMIKTGIDERTEKKYYFLVSTSNDGSMKMVTKLIRHRNKFYLNIEELIYVVCYNCTTSYPEIYNGFWGCESRDMFTCEKAEIAKF